MTRKMHWTETAELVSGGDWRILGEDEHGDLLVPVREGWWQGRYNPRNPAHWRFWLRSRLTKRLAFVESE